MSTFFRYVHDSDKKIVESLLSHIVMEQFYGSHVILVGDKYIKKKILRELSQAAKIEIINKNKPYVTKYRKTIVIKDYIMIKFDKNLISNGVIQKYYLRTSTPYGYKSEPFGYNLIILAKSIDSSEAILKIKNTIDVFQRVSYIVIKLRKSKHYYIEQFKS